MKNENYLRKANFLTGDFTISESQNQEKERRSFNGCWGCKIAKCSVGNSASKLLKRSFFKKRKKESTYKYCPEFRNTLVPGISESSNLVTKPLSIPDRSLYKFVDPYISCTAKSLIVTAKLGNVLSGFSLRRWNFCNCRASVRSDFFFGP